VLRARRRRRADGTTRVFAAAEGQLHPVAIVDARMWDAAVRRARLRELEDASGTEAVQRIDGRRTLGRREHHAHEDRPMSVFHSTDTARREPRRDRLGDGAVGFGSCVEARDDSGRGLDGHRYSTRKAKATSVRRTVSGIAARRAWASLAVISRTTRRPTRIEKNSPRAIAGTWRYGRMSGRIGVHGTSAVPSRF